MRDGGTAPRPDAPAEDDAAARHPEASADPAAPRLAAFAAGLRPEHLPEQVSERLKLHLLDALGCALAAAALGEQRAAVALDRGGGRLGPLALGALCHALDYDDTHPGSICHVSAVAGPAALCAAAASGASGAEALAAYAAGVEITARLGATAGGDMHRRGVHPTSACGVLGAAAAASRALGLDAERTADAVGLAASRAAGVLAALVEEVPVKPLHAGWAARDGIECARLAEAGAAGPRGAIDGHQGLFDALLGERRAVRVDDLGQVWESARVAIKPYPVCHFIHGSLAAAQRIHGQLREGEEIAGGLAACDDAGAWLVLEPRAEKVAPRTTYGARFALAWCVACVLRHGGLTPADLTGPALHDAETKDLAGRIATATLPRDPQRDAFAGAVSVTTDGGRELAERCDAPPGGPARPLSAAAIVAKYESNAAMAMTPGASAELAERVLALDDQPSVDAILAAVEAAAS